MRSIRQWQFRSTLKADPPSSGKRAGGVDIVFHAVVGHKSPVFIERARDADGKVLRDWCLVEREDMSPFQQGFDELPPPVAGPFDTLRGAMTAFLVLWGDKK